MQKFRTQQQPILGERQRARGEEREREEREMMLSIMATPLRWRTHSALTNREITMVCYPL